MPNSLASSLSTYLLQHKDNPIWWHSWGPQAFKEAQARNVPIFLSIGYSSCYWCHVMEKDSFESQEVADILNEHFVSIKVDREERPDVDEVYMDAVVGLHGHGGWPLTLFLTPSLHPFWGATFLRRVQLITVLEQIRSMWSGKRDRIDAAVQGIESDILRPMRALPSADASSSHDGALFAEATTRFRHSYDARHGGFGGAPKFPPTSVIPFLLREGSRLHDGSLTAMALDSLEMMARGGIHDIVGGGFHRYSVDAEWLVPHFEKMLYDNALLSLRYLEAYAQTGRNDFAWIASRTLDWMERELLVDNTAFGSSLDAGEVGEEGLYYTWTHDELATIWGSHADECRSVFFCPPGGNFEHGRIVLSAPLPTEYRHVIDLLPHLEQLRAAREQRLAPSRDDKILVGWNGLAISALAYAGVLIDPHYLERAISVMNYLRNSMTPEGRCLRRGFHGSWGIAAMLEDYAYLIEALLNLYEATTDNQWLSYATTLQHEQDALLWHEGTGRYQHSDAPELVITTHSGTDGALPSPNAVSLSNLDKLERYTGHQHYEERYQALAQSLRGDAARYPHGTATILSALWDHRYGVDVVVAIPSGTECRLRAGIAPMSFPGATVIQIREDRRETVHDTAVAEVPLPPAQHTGMFADKTVINGETTMYLCQRTRCFPPVHGEKALTSTYYGIIQESPS